MNKEYNPYKATGTDELYLFRYDLEAVAKQYGMQINIDKLITHFNYDCKNNIDTVYTTINDIMEYYRFYQRKILTDE